MIDTLKRSRLIASATAIVLLGGLGASCGKSSPTSPTPSTTAQTRVISVEGSLTFGEVVVGESRELTVTLRNSGTGTMNLSGITGSGGVTTQTVASPTSGSIPAGGSLAVVFRFTPTSPGAISGTITFTTDHTSGTNTATLSGAGVGVPITLVGVVIDSNTRRPVGGVRVAALTSSVANVGSATTDGNGFYSMVVPSGMPLSVGYARDGYNFQSSTITFTTDTRRDINLVPFWTMSGIGNTVFDMPTNVRRVRIIGTYNASGSNFIVWVGNRLVVNEIIGTGREGGPRYEGLHAVTGGVVRIENSRDVQWSFAQEQ